MSSQDKAIGGRPLKKEVLEAMAKDGCNVCGKDVSHPHKFFFHSRCHPTSSRVELSYSAGFLTVACGVCRTFIAQIEVAA